jgi:hypothetical protein
MEVGSLGKGAGIMMRKTSTTGLASGFRIFVG